MLTVLPGGLTIRQSRPKSDDTGVKRLLAHIGPPRLEQVAECNTIIAISVFCRTRQHGNFRFVLHITSLDGFDETRQCASLAMELVVYARTLSRRGTGVQLHPNDVHEVIPMQGSPCAPPFRDRGHVAVVELALGYERALWNWEQLRPCPCIACATGEGLMGILSEVDEIGAALL